MEKRAGAFQTGTYRNLFKECGYTEAEIEKKVGGAFEELFYGDESTKIHYLTDDGKAYILDTGNFDVRTEGMSYGMMMCVQLGRKKEFDRLWDWAFTHMLMSSGENRGYFAWSVAPDGTKNSDGPAPDGEEYFAMALLFASHRWGDGKPPFDYGAQAKKILCECLHKGEDGGRGSAMWDRENKLISFVPGSAFTDPSYHLPHFYELFSLWGDAWDRQFWKEAAGASREYLQRSCHPETGLAAEYAEFDGTPRHNEGHGFFFSDAYRVAGNIGLDSEWFGENGAETQIANRIQDFFAKEKDIAYRKYDIGGTVGGKSDYFHRNALLAMNAMASLAADGPYARENVAALWKLPLRRDGRRYYDNCLHFFSLLALSGNYRIW